jgi:hypothetical protein
LPHFSAFFGLKPQFSFSCLDFYWAQALVDFSLQMQAVTLTLLALLGAGVAQSESSWMAVND